jgi:putative PIN family toxin of toxin-antitoxin system
MLPLRLVLDTNILVSAALKPSSLPRTVFLIALTRPARLYISQPIFAEYRDVLSRPELRIRKPLRLQFLDLLRNRAHMVSPTLRIQAAFDPHDNIFLECADAARADYLITGNPRHFPPFWKQSKIITARPFITLAAPHLAP